jgi:hypothetical protein
VYSNEHRLTYQKDSVVKRKKSRRDIIDYGPVVSKFVEDI